jgi:hypothetical protein
MSVQLVAHNFMSVQLVAHNFMSVQLVAHNFMSVQLISTTLLSKTPNTGTPFFWRLSFFCTLLQLVVDWLVSRLYVIKSRSEVPKHGMKANMGVEINLHPFMTSAQCGDDCSSFTRPGKWPDSRTTEFKKTTAFYFSEPSVLSPYLYHAVDTWNSFFNYEEPNCV